MRECRVTGAAQRRLGSASLVAVVATANTVGVRTPTEQLVAHSARRSRARILSVVAVTMDEVRAFASTLPRSNEAFVRGRMKFRVGRIVFLSFSKDGTVMGFGFPKEWRAALVESEPEKFSMPSESDVRYSWVHARLAAIDRDEMRDLVENAWALCVPMRVVDDYAGARGYRTGA